MNGYKEELLSFIDKHAWSKTERITAMYTGFHMINVLSDKKPEENVFVEDVYSAIRDIFSGCSEDGPDSDDHDECVNELYKFAEAYHVKKSAEDCKRCITELDDIDRASLAGL